MTKDFCCQKCQAWFKEKWHLEKHIKEKHQINIDNTKEWIAEQIKQRESEIAMTDETYMEMRAKEICPEAMSEPKQESKWNFRNAFFESFTIFIFVVLFLGATLTYNDISMQKAKPSCDLNTTTNLLAYSIVQDANAHQIIYNAILSEQQAKAFLSTCTLVSQDFNQNTQTIICRTPQGAK